MLRDTLKKIMNSTFCTFFLALSGCFAFGQPSETLESPKPKGFINKVEVFGGAAINFPNVNGWDCFIFNSTNGQQIYESKEKTGHILGISLIHSVTERFDIQGRFSLDQRKYFETDVTFDSNGQPYAKATTDHRNDYITFSLVPTYFFLKPNRLHIFSGLSYLHLTKSLAFGTTYVNGQYVGSASINTIDGFEKHVVDALVGVGYFFPLRLKIDCVIRFQGNYGLSNLISQNKYSVTANSLSLALAIRYGR